MINALNLASRLDREHSLGELLIVGGTVSARMNTPMTCRIKSDNQRRVIWSPVTHSVNVMWLQVRASVFSQERRRVTAPFTIAIRPSENIVANYGASLVNRSRRALSDVGGVTSCRNRLVSQGRKVPLSGYWRCLGHIYNLFKEAQLKNERVSQITPCVSSSAFDDLFTHHFANETKPAALGLFKQEKAFAVGRVSSNGGISAGQGHIANLTFAEIFEAAVVEPRVVIPVGSAGNSGDGKNDRKVSRRDNPALSLTTKLRMYVSPFVDLISDKAPRHQQHSATLKILIDGETTPAVNSCGAC